MSLKSLSVTFLVLIAFGTSTIAAKKEKSSPAKKYQFEFTISDSEDSLVFLANYYGKKTILLRYCFCCRKRKIQI